MKSLLLKNTKLIVSVIPLAFFTTQVLAATNTAKEPPSQVATQTINTKAVTKKISDGLNSASKNLTMCMKENCLNRPLTLKSCAFSHNCIQNYLEELEKLSDQ